MPLAHGTGVVPEVRPLQEEETAFVSIQTTTILARLLPDATLLRLEACAIDDATTQITLAVRSTQATAPCPLCTTPARRIHSDYERTLADLPWAHSQVRLQLRVRKWFCRNRHCPRRIFTERLPTVAAPWARRTLRLAQRFLALGAALGGRAGVRLGHAWDLAVSRHTLLHGLRRHPVPAFPTPMVLGVDDLALRKGQTYGTVLIDLERRRYEQVCHLAQQGWKFRAIAQQVGVHRKTVAQYVRADSYPVRARPPSVLDPYKPYVLACWNRGCRTGMRLYEEIQRQGYRGGRSTVLGYLTQLRKAQGLAPQTRTVQPSPPVTDPSVPCSTPRQATWLVLRQPDHLTEEEQALLDRLPQAHPAFAQAMALTQGFAQLLRARQPERLDAWLQQAATSSLTTFQRVAKSFQRDSAAIKAGMTLPWSTSPVEGHINRLKMLKRQMFGRARLDLHSHRFLRAPRGGQECAQRPQAPAEAHREPAAT